jgi:hypothetical protein
MKIKNTLLKVLGGLVLTYFAITVIASEGIVVDEQGKPIKGAHVITYWHGNAGLIVQPHTRCYKLEATTSDENGKFRVPMYSGSLNPFMKDRTLITEVFAASYYTSSLSKSEDLKFVLAPLNKLGTKGEKFQKFSRFRADCGHPREKLPFYKAMYEEMIRLATTKEEKRACISLLFTIESTEFGDSVAHERLNQRERSAAKVEAI